MLDEFKENHGISGAVRSLYHIASKVARSVPTSLSYALSGDLYPLVLHAQTDGLILEDESGRIALGGEMVMAHIGQMVTGVVVAVKGSVGADGVMQVCLNSKPTVWIAWSSLGSYVKLSTVPVPLHTYRCQTGPSRTRCSP